MDAITGKPFTLDSAHYTRCISLPGGMAVPIRAIINYADRFGPATYGELIHAAQEQGYVRTLRRVDGQDVPSREWGLAIARPFRLDDPYLGNFRSFLDDPSQLGWFIDGGVGVRSRDVSGEAIRQMESFIGNAVRKLRPLARLFDLNSGPWSTLQIAEIHPRWFLDPVESVEADGVTMLWGDFPHGGAVIVIVGGWVVMASVSGFTAPQDHLLATAAATRFAEWLSAYKITRIVEVDLTT